MNQIRILRLGVEKRNEYIRSCLVKMKRPELAHLAHEAGARDVREMSKDDLIALICDSLMQWAERMELE